MKILNGIIFYMRKFLILIFIFLLWGTKAGAIEIVYPKTNPVKINSPSSFFIGSADPKKTLKINGIKVRVTKIGAFAQAIPLTEGKNKFKITSGEETIEFIIKRPKTRTYKKREIKTIEYPLVPVYVKRDNAPLRMTPVNAGINRMAHLPKNTKLLVNGEKGGFYRVYLNSNLEGWIYKSYVKQKDFNTKLAVLKSFKINEDKNYCKYEFEIDRKIPFTVKEEDGLKLEIFNLKNQNDNTLSMNIPIKKLFGYETYYDDEKFVLKVRKAPKINQNKPLKCIKIVIDAGHGGYELGAIGCCGDNEKDINLAIAKDLKKELEKRGANIIMTREKDIRVSLSSRVELAKDKEALLLISIHANALPDKKDPNQHRGTSIYYYHPQAQPLAENILKEMINQVGTKNDNVRQGSLALVRPTANVSVLIEVAYMINPDDTALLIDKKFQQDCARAVADGIENYLKTQSTQE